MNNLFSPYHFKEDLTLDRERAFTQNALEVFQAQAIHNSVYQVYLQNLRLQANRVEKLGDIPFLPISFFKSHLIRTGKFEPEVYFESSGTTGMRHSRHGIMSKLAYLQNAEKNFIEFYGHPSQYCILALLPSYLEKGNSSLVAMAEDLIQKSGHPISGFFLHDFQKLGQTLLELEAAKQPTILLGVTYALLDFAEQYPLQLKYTIVMETGGMKGRREEITRASLHQILCRQFGVKVIHAEYGMTELQSQAYSKGDGWFKTSSTMKVLLRSPDDPFDIWDETQFPNRTGAVNIIDLANVDTISFIATDDLARFREDGCFEIIGRMDNCDIRGCSQLAI